MKMKSTLIKFWSIATATMAAGEPTSSSCCFSVVDASIPEIQKALHDGIVTSRQLVEQYLQRIATYDLILGATMEVSPTALSDADRFDLERQQAASQNSSNLPPLHGIPIALK